MKTGPSSSQKNCGDSQRSAALQSAASRRLVFEACKKIQDIDQNPRFGVSYWVKNDAKVSGRAAAIRQPRETRRGRRCDMQTQTGIRAGNGPWVGPDG